MKKSLKKEKSFKLYGINPRIYTRITLEIKRFTILPIPSNNKEKVEQKDYGGERQ